MQCFMLAQIGTKQVDVKYPLITEVLKDGLITLIKMNTSQNLVDALTKCLPKAHHQMVAVNVA